MEVIEACRRVILPAAPFVCWGLMALMILWALVGSLADRMPALGGAVMFLILWLTVMFFRRLPQGSDRPE